MSNEHAYLFNREHAQFEKLPSKEDSVIEILESFQIINDTILLGYIADRNFEILKAYQKKNEKLEKFPSQYLNIYLLT